MTTKRSVALKIPFQLRAHKIVQLARNAGFTIDELHDLWMSGRTGNLISDKEVHRLLVEHPRLAFVFEVFARGHDLRQGRHLRRQLLEAKPANNPETIWTASKPKWISVVKGGLPTLGKRR